jgi:hypothetical protein
MAVTVYRNNRLDQAEEVDPDKLAKEFVATLKGEVHPEFERSNRMNVEFEYRWWLSDNKIHGYTWKDEAWPELWEALMRYMSDDEINRAVIDAICNV